MERVTDCTEHASDAERGGGNAHGLRYGGDNILCSSNGDAGMYVYTTGSSIGM